MSQHSTTRVAPGQAQAPAAPATPHRVVSRWERLEEIPYLGIFIEQVRIILSDRMGLMGSLLLVAFVLLAILAPYIAPYDPLARHSDPDGLLLRTRPPSAQHWLGTTSYGRDVLSQVIHGSRVAITVGFISSICIVLIGTNMGLHAGYWGGWVDATLMRLTDVIYGIPFLPFAIILVTLTRPSIWTIILAIVLLLWRFSARIIRSQVLSLRERPFVKAARAAGASHWRIIYVHIAPNVLPMSFLYMAFGVAFAVLVEASLSFLGLGDPEVVSWGSILHYAFISGGMRRAWWWTVPPGIAIALFVVSCFMIGRAYEEVVNPRLRAY
ncbi:MAG: ABC transporter permease [Candidatus Methylomirabilia bacterium]